MGSRILSGTQSTGTVRGLYYTITPMSTQYQCSPADVQLVLCSEHLSLSVLRPFASTGELLRMGERERDSVK